MIAPRTVFLIGLPGSGKTHFGRYLAGRIQYQFFDLDHYIEKHEGRRISEIFSSEGEAAFRQIESNALRNLSLSNAVISTGGGTPCFHENMEWMNRRGLTVFLDPPFELILSRLQRQKHRPLLKSNLTETLKALESSRRLVYEKAGIHLVETQEDALYKELIRTMELKN